LNKLEEEPIPLEDLTSEQKKLRCVVLSNRAMAYLKIQETTKALADANMSLTFDPKYAKSYYRRAECYKKLQNYKASLKDFQMVKQLEPHETKPDAEIKKI
jgi:serine/threonine-protein phosphatase 5